MKIKIPALSTFERAHVSLSMPSLRRVGGPLKRKAPAQKTPSVVSDPDNKLGLN